MKKLFLLISIALCFAPKALYAQERINKPIPKIGTQISGQLTKATGWLLNPQGQWVSGPNKIPAYTKLLSVDEFNSYQFREVKIQDSTYSIFIKKYDKITAKDGTSFYNFLFYVFNKSELGQLTNIKIDTINLFKINVMYSGDLYGITNDTYISEIQKEIARQIQAKNNPTETDKELEKEGVSVDSPIYLIFHIAPYKSKNIVQFQIYSCQGFDTDNNNISGVSNAMAVTEDGEGEKFFLTNDLFKHCYFETDYQTFNGFIRLSN